jgi:hypothetical protein
MVSGCPARPAAASDKIQAPEIARAALRATKDEMESPTFMTETGHNLTP